MRRADCCLACAMMLSRGVRALCGSEGVVAPDRAGVPVVGRRLDMMPVFVRSRVRFGVELPSESCGSRGHENWQTRKVWR